MGITSTRRIGRATRLAKAAEERQDYVGAYRRWKKAAAVFAGSSDTADADCGSARCYAGMAKALVAEGEYGDALDLYNRATSLYRRTLSGFPEVGQRRERRGEEPDLAEEPDLMTVLLDAAVCWFYRGTACMALGLEDEARESWQYALQIWLQLGVESEEAAWCSSLLGLAPGARIRRDDARMPVQQEIQDVAVGEGTSEPRAGLAPARNERGARGSDGRSGGSSRTGIGHGTLLPEPGPRLLRKAG